jgi:glycosyltransferase involved in cell wall biosynthesis
MKVILNIPIEPLEERYSNQWRKWFSNAFAAEGFHVVDIDPPATTSGLIHRGSFLDVVETNQYKTLQTLQIINQIILLSRDIEIILFFHDLWHPGLSNIAYVRDGLQLPNIRICGCLHAGSYDDWDFLNKVGMRPWAMHLENGWFGKIADQIYVATGFHKNLLASRRRVDPDKIIVTGFPMYPDFISEQYSEKDNIIVFPHRLDIEKQPVLFDKLCSELTNMNWRCIKSKEVVATKKEYYELLKQSKIAISFARQETWGIAMQEAVLCGCVPVCPNSLSYPEMYSNMFLYDTFEEAVKKVREFMEHPPIESVKYQQQAILNSGRKAIPMIIKNMKQL